MSRVSHICIYGDIPDTIQDTFTVDVTVHPPVAIPYHTLDKTRVQNIFRPFGAKGTPPEPPIYDGYMLCDTLTHMIPPHPHTLHIILTDHLIGTYDDQSMRYHANPIILSNPCIISIPGIIYGPARPKPYCIEMAYTTDTRATESRYAGQFITDGDPRLPSIIRGYMVQGLAYFESGEPFCSNKNCILYNARWQSDMIRCHTNPRLCARHQHYTGRMTLPLYSGTPSARSRASSTVL